MLKKESCICVLNRDDNDGGYRWFVFVFLKEMIMMIMCVVNLCLVMFVSLSCIIC